MISGKKVLSVLRKSALLAVLALFLLNFMIPTIAPAAPVRDGPFVVFGEQSSGNFRCTLPDYDDWYIHSYFIIFLRPTYQYLVSVEIIEVFDDGVTLLWEDVEVSINTDDGRRDLRVIPYMDTDELGIDEDDDTIIAMYINDAIMHGYIYPGDTLYLVNVPEDLDGALVKVTLDGESLGSFKMDLDPIIHYYL